MRYNWIFRCHGNIYYIIFIDVYFCKVHSIGAITVCTNFEINMYKFNKFRNMQKRVLFDVVMY